MNPVLATLMMAAHGHTGLPTQIGGAAPSPMGGLPGGIPGSAPAPGGSGNVDKQIAQTTEQHLLAMAPQIKDPQLKAVFSTALSSLHKYLAMDAKEHQQALAGKVSPRLMAIAHGTNG